MYIDIKQGNDFCSPKRITADGLCLSTETVALIPGTKLKDDVNRTESTSALDEDWPQQRPFKGLRQDKPIRCEKTEAAPCEDTHTARSF